MRASCSVSSRLEVVTNSLYAAVLQDVARLPGLQGRVDRHETGARLQGPEKGDYRLDTLRQVHADAGSVW